MRKTLLTTTALVMSAGAAVAQVNMEGHAEIGVAGSQDDSARFHTDVDVTFVMSGETDGGLSFEAKVDLDENEAFDPDTHGGVAITLGGPFGNVALGDTDGAFDWALTETAKGGSLRDDETSHAGYDGNSGLDGTHDGQILRYDSSAGGIGFALSVEMDDEIDGTGGAGGAIIGLGAKYSMGMGGGTLNLGLGHQSGDTGTAAVAADATATPPVVAADATTTSHSILGFSAAYDAGTGLSAILNWSSKDVEGARDDDDNSLLGDVSTSHIGLGVGYKSGPLTVGFNWGSKSAETTLPVSGDDPMVTTADSTGFAISTVYNLGVGADLQFGFGSGETETTVSGTDGSTTVDDSSWSLGLAFSF